MKRVHLFGASASGTTTLGAALATSLHFPHFDTDTYFWEPTDPPFQTVRERPDRQALLRHDLERCDSWVLSGSLCGWGDFSIPMFDLAIFLYLPPAIRMARLKKREFERYGPSISDSEDPRYVKHQEFLDWAANYDDGGLDTRSRKSHEEWIATLPCELVRLEQDKTVQVNLQTVLDEMAHNGLQVDLDTKHLHS